MAERGEVPREMIDSVKPPLVIFVAMPASDMGLHATWVDTAAIKHHLYDPVAEQVAAALGAEVDLRIEKDKISQGAIHRQQWIIQRIRHAAPEVVVIKNRDTGMCFAHPPPPADDSDIRIFQYQCVPDARTEWAIEKPPPIGAKDCRDQGEVRIRNHEIGFYVGYGDQNSRWAENDCSCCTGSGLQIGG